MDAVIAFEHTSDDRERAVQAVLVETCGDFRELHVLSELAGRLGDAADALTRCALILRDYILETLKTRLMSPVASHTEVFWLGRSIRERADIAGDRRQQGGQPRTARHWEVPQPPAVILGTAFCE